MKPVEISDSMTLDQDYEEKINSSGNFIFVGVYDNFTEAKLKTNKISHLKLTFSSENFGHEVHAGPIKKNEIQSTLNFLRTNGFKDAEIY